MRDIKFRVWDGNKFHYTPKFNMHFSKSGIIAALDNGSMVFNKSNEIQQYTDRKDKNNKDIYDGDLINSYQNDYMATEVFWDNDCCQWATQNYHSTLNLSDSMDKDTEIVGNIHQDKGLLR